MKNPAAAGFLSFFPGLGHVYLGLYQRAAIFFAVWVVLISVVHHAPVPAGLMIPFWWFFVLIDAVRQAKAINATGAPESNVLSNEKPMNFSGSLTFGIFLVLVGLFFFVDRWFRVDLSFLFDFWPLLLIGFGVWQIFSYWKSKQPKASEGPKLGG
ncbi:MAG: LiaI-LiaF-like domain-containing protein [Thermoanaerobaculia bacterium]